MEETPTPLTATQLTKRQELNNHVVLMRKAVKRSKVHLINKLVREAKKLNSRKGPEKGQEKSKRKATRLLEEIAALKHLKTDEVSVHALQDKKSLEEVISAPGASTEARALARLSHHQFIQLEVSKYREQNPHWELQIPVLLEKSKEKLKKAKKKQEKKEQEKIKDDTNFEEESIPLLVPIDPLNNKTETPSDEGRKPDIASIESNLDKRAIKKQKAAAKAAKKNNQVDKSEGTIKIQHLKSLEDLEKSLSKPKQVSLPSSDEIEAEVVPKRPRSSFFVGGIEEEEEESEDHHHQSWRTDKPTDRFPRNPRNNQGSEPKPIFRKGKLISRPPPNRFGGVGRESRLNTRTPRYFDKNSESKQQPRNNNFNQNSTRDSVVPSGEKLHPSWEAKKRLAKVSIISGVQGKKIAFTDD